MSGRPTGTVTFLFTDVEGSTRLWEAAPQAMAAALRRHDEIVRAVIHEEGGHVFSVAGDSFGVAFQDHRRAITASRRIQRALAAEPWPDGAAIAVRMGLHIGSSDEERGDNYYGTAVNTAARVMAVADGGQVVLSDALRAVTDEAVVAHGTHRAKGLAEPLVLWRLVLGPGAPSLSLRQTGDHTWHNLPVSASRLFGREDDLDRAVRALADHRLVTLVGPGGIGKTTLATAVGRSATGFRDGVRLVELAPATGTRVAHQLADAVGAVERPGRTMAESVVAYLAERELLVVLDNCEHVLDAVVPLVEAMQRSCPGVTVLATSREPLELRSEHVLRVDGLVSDAAAVALFYARAEAVGGVLPDDEAGRALVASLCARLDGMPLAIELAAARTRSVDVGELGRRLERAVRPARPGRGDNERHRTVDATIAWSYDLLAADEARVFRRLSVFVDGFDLGAAEDVCADGELDADDVFDAVDRLVAKSLVVRRGDGRLRLLEPIRWFARERLVEEDESEPLRDRHLGHFAARADRCYRDVPVQGDDELLRLLDVDRSNLIAATEWAIERGNVDAGLRIVLAAPIGLFQLRFEFHDLAERLVELPGAARHPRYVEALVLPQGVAFQRGRFDTAQRLAEAALAADRSDRPDPHLAMLRAAGLLLVDGRADLALEAFGAIETGDHWVRCMCDFLGAVAFRDREFADGQRRLRAAVAWARSIRATAYEAMLLEQLAQGEVLHRDGDPATGATLAAQAIPLARRHGLPFIEAQAELHVARAALRLGTADVDVAGVLARSLRTALLGGVVPNQWFVLLTCASFLAHRGLGEEAALIAACRPLNPFARAASRPGLAEGWTATHEERARAAEIAPTITDTEQLSRHILAVLDALAAR